MKINYLLRFFSVFISTQFVILQSQAGNNVPKIKIHALLCLSGGCAKWGDASLKGARLAVKEINKNGGVLGRLLELKIEDTNEESPSNSVMALKRILAEKDTSFILGPTWSAAGLAFAPIIKNRNLIAVSPSLGIKDYNESADNIFNIWPHDENSTRALASYAYKKGYRKIAIFGASHPWTETQSNAFEETFKALGGKISQRVEPLYTDNDLIADAQKIINSKPEAIIFTAFDQLSIAAKSVSELGFKGQKFAALIDEERLKLANGALDDTIMAGYPKSSAEFITAFKAEYNEEPQISADKGYDFVKLLVSAIKKAGSLDISKINEELKKTKNFPGASGNITFDNQGGLIKDPVFYAVKENNFIPLNN